VKLSLHTWTLDTTPLPDVLRIIRSTGWDAVELRRIDFVRAVEAGGRAEDVLDLVRKSGLAVSCVGAQLGWMFASRDERAQLMRYLDDSCRWAAALGCSTVMSPVDRGTGDLATAADAVRAAGDVAGKHGVRLALEQNSQAEQFSTLDRARELLSRAGHASCGLLLDAYHLQRSGSLGALGTVTPAEIAYVQFSDVPASGLEPGKALDRLPPGKGVVPFREFFRAVADKGYGGYASYEAPNPAAWARDGEAVAREALEASRPLLPR
jgi:sugar phosphate isomerase/epimerase